jgi:uncharacterized protein
MVALLDKGQGNHRRCKAAFKSLPRPLLTTWPCITEALYFLGELREWEGQKALWTLVEKDVIRIHAASADEWKRVRELMEQYQDTPMDCADASLVALAELKGLRTVFTLDRDFYIYRIHGKDTFDVVPLDAQP